MRPRRIGLLRHKHAWLSIVLIVVAAAGASTVSARAGTSLVTGSAHIAINSPASPGIINNDPCSSFPDGSVIIAGSAWAGGLGSPVTASGANFDVHSNWDGSSCWRSPEASDGVNQWGIQYQCTELAVRAADLEWNEGGSSSWAAAGWNGNAYNMFDVAAGLPTPLVAVPNGSGTLPSPGDIMVWGATANDSTGHVGVVERIDTSAQRVWVVSQNSMYAEFGIPYSGTTIDPTGAFGLPLRGWLSDPRPVRGVALRSDGQSGYTLNGWGGVVPFGGAPPVRVSAYWRNWDVTRGIAMLPNATGGYVLDAYGGVHQFGTSAPVTVTGYWPGWDIARGIVVRPDGRSGYVLDGYGGLHPFGGAPDVTITGYWAGWDIARAVVLRPDGVSGWVLDGYGVLHPFGGAANVSISAWWGWDIARAAVLAGDGTDPLLPLDSGWVLDGYGGLHPFGGAPPAAVPPSAYHYMHDVARGVAFEPLVDAGVTVSGPYPPAQFQPTPPVRAVAAQPGASSGYVLDGWGGLTPFGGAPAASAGAAASWPNWDIARGLALRSDGTSGYILDGYGGVHPFGGAPSVNVTGYTAGQDLARGIVLRSDGASGYVLDAYGNLWPFGGAVPFRTATPFTTSIARAAVLLSNGTGGYILDAFGGIRPFGSATMTQAQQWPGWDIARGIAMVTQTSGYVLDGWGGLHPFGGAPAVSAPAYFPGFDVARGVAVASQPGSPAVSGVVVYLDGDMHSFISS